MSILWNSTLVSHSTLIFFEELSSIKFLKLFTTGYFFDIYDYDSGALVCIATEAVNQRWYLTNGEDMNEVGLRIKVTFYNSEAPEYSPDYARINRFNTRSGPVKTLDEQLYNGLWSCRYGTGGETDEAVYVGVYASPGRML